METNISGFNTFLATKQDIAELKKDVAIIMGSYSFLILGALVTLAKFGLLTPTP